MKRATEAKKSKRVRIMDTQIYDQRQTARQIANVLQTDLIDPLMMGDNWLRDLYHIDYLTAQRLIAQTEKHLPMGRIPVRIRVFSALHYFAHGRFQPELERVFCNKQMANVLLVANAIKKLTPLHIKFPDTASYGPIKENFLLKTGFPDCIGSLDCTQIPIKEPYVKSIRKKYLNEDGNYSMNLHLVTDYNLRIVYADCSHSGATRDCEIFDNSTLNETLHQRYLKVKEDLKDTFILADSRYIPRPWLIVPFYKPNEANDALHNKTHARARNCSLRVDYALKHNFQCLRFLDVNPEGAEAIIASCVVLHNMLFDREFFKNDYMDENMMQYKPKYKPLELDLVNANVGQLIDGYQARDRATSKIAANEEIKKFKK